MRVVDTLLAEGSRSAAAFFVFLLLVLPVTPLFAQVQRLPSVTPNAEETGPSPRVVGRQFPVVVPDLSGLGRSQAAAVLTRAGLVAGEVAERPAAVDSERIVGQKPAAGERVPAGSQVAMVVAVPRLVEVPDLAGLSRERALATLEKYGLGKGAVQETSSARPQGTVIGQQPAAGSRVAAGTPVAVTVAVGETVQVPDLAGLSRDEGIRLLGRSQLNVGAIGERQDVRPANTIVAQKPPAGAVVPPWTPVAFAVAAARPVEVPDLRGLKLARAEAVLRKAGLASGEVRNRPSPQPENTVIGQEPPPGTKVDVGAAVAMAVAVPEIVEVPGVVGESSARAGDILTGAGLRTGTVTRREGNAADGVVLEQRPAAGTTLRKGEAVDLVLSRKIAVIVPDVVGMPLAEAEGVLQRSRLRTGAVSRRQAEASADTVVGQQPAAGTDLAQGSAVELTLAEPAGPQPTVNNTAVAGGQGDQAAELIAVPNLLGATREQAYATLSDSGLAVGGVSERIADREPGTIVDQHPGPGNLAAGHTPVDLVIARRPALALTWKHGVGALFLVFYAGYRLAMRRKARGREGGPAARAVAVRPHPDPGRQEMDPAGGGIAGPLLHLRPRRDSGEQRLECDGELVEKGGGGHGG
ncbi:MAG: PASTA domain-containing protein [Thermodesulfobacteriota bacterium]